MAARTTNRRNPVARKRKPLRTDIGWSDASSITLFGKDFPSEILGHLNLGDMGFLELTGRLPSAGESRMFNAMGVTLVEHGLTPSAPAARLTYLGAPDRTRVVWGKSVPVREDSGG